MCCVFLHSCFLHFLLFVSEFSFVMAPPIDPLMKICPEREAWRVKVRIVRLWYLPSFNNPTAISSIEMVLMDEFGCKIHASVRKTLVYKFKPLLSEGHVYIMAYFGVGVNLGSFRTTKHEFRLNFQLRTTVKPSESISIPLHGLSVVSLEEIFGTDGDSAFLVDVMGLLTGIGAEKEYERDGKLTKMVVIELDVDSVKIECALFGKYVDEVNSFIASGDVFQPVVIVQFAKVKTFKGKTVLQNVIHATRLLFNPDIPEVNEFKKKLPEMSQDNSQIVSHLSDAAQYSIEDDFLRVTPRKTIEQLKDSKEEGSCIVYATVKHVIKDCDWWYTACKCNKAVTPDSGMYYCDSCYCHVVNVFPRYRIKLRVVDETDCATFVLFDRDAYYVMKKSASDMLEQVQKSGGGDSNYPAEFDVWIEKSFLFKVDTKCSSNSQFEASFRVRRICDDVSVLTHFQVDGSALTPKEGVFTAGLSDSLTMNSEVPEVDSGIAKDLMPHFCESVICLDSQPEPSVVKMTPIKRKFDDDSRYGSGQMSSTKLKEVKIEKD